MLVVKDTEGWAVTHQQRWHSEALQTYGERVVVRHRWNIQDFSLGRVDRCTSCQAGVKLNERQRIRVIGATGGTFTLTFAGQTTGPIPYNATATQIQDALEALSNIEPGDVIVSAPIVDQQATDWSFLGEDWEEIRDQLEYTPESSGLSFGVFVEFRGTYAYLETIALLTANTSNLSSNAEVEVVQIQAGTGGAATNTRISKVYKQSGSAWCDACYGIGFEGGFEPLVYVTWALITDSRQETTRSQAGVMQKEDPSVQFSFVPPVQEYDIVARVHTWEDDGVTPHDVHGRFLLKEVMPLTLRTGPGMPDDGIGSNPPNFLPHNALTIGQTCGIEILPREHPWQDVPLTRFEENLVSLGANELRNWYKRHEVAPVFTPNVEQS